VPKEKKNIGNISRNRFITGRKKKIRKVILVS
jgi:hypothetical protein